MIIFTPTQEFTYTNDAGVDTEYLKDQVYRINESNKAMVENVERWQQQGRVQITARMQGQHNPIRVQVSNKQ